MKKIVGTTLFTVAFILFVSSLAVSWVVYRKDQVEFKIPKKVKGIDSIGVEYDGQRIFLNVRGDENISCDQVYRLLHIEPIVVSGKIYDPSCGQMDENTIQVIYVLESKV